MQPLAYTQMPCLLFLSLPPLLMNIADYSCFVLCEWVLPELQASTLSINIWYQLVSWTTSFPSTTTTSTSQFHLIPLAHPPMPKMGLIHKTRFCREHNWNTGELHNIPLESNTALGDSSRTLRECMFPWVSLRLMTPELTRDPKTVHYPKLGSVFCHWSERISN